MICSAQSPVLEGYRSSTHFLSEAFVFLIVAEKVDANRLVVPGCTAEVIDLIIRRYRLAEGPARCFPPPHRQFRALTLQRINIRWDLYRDILLPGDFKCT